MELIRRYSLLVTAGALAVAVMFGAIAGRPAVSANAASSLARAASYFDSTVVLARNAKPRGLRGDQLAIALGYLERLRLGFGSPFRLSAEALRDPRLDPTMGTRVAWGILARLRRGDAYVVDPSVLDGTGPWGGGADGRVASGADHVALIEQTVAAAKDPRAGELAVRLAYMIAAAKGTIAQPSVSVAAQVAALARDRALAAHDLRDLLADANEERTSVMSLLTERRMSRGFRVEQPPLAPLDADVQNEAMAEVPSLLRALDTLDRSTPAELQGARASLLNEHFAERLEDLGADRPPLAQIAVTLRTRARVTLNATNDETLIANLARKQTMAEVANRENALAVLASAVSMRTLAQDAPWFPGDRGPDVADLTAEFGLADVVFTRGVPYAWRPFYVRQLQTGLRDMQRVLPALSLAGLHVRIGSEPLRDSALAMHDPRTRTLHLSMATSGGTLAHELAHDLDWQSARRLYADGSGYSTDRAMRERKGALATSMLALAEARLMRPLGTTPPPPSIGRPTEMFARGVDWFVASSLARQGRSNGFLTVVGDALLAGYAAGPPTAMGIAGASALSSAIGEMTYLPDSIRSGFEAQWSDVRVVDPMLVVRRALDTPIAMRSSISRAASTSQLLSGVRPKVCAVDDSPEVSAREDLLMLAVDARAAGVAARRARYRYAGMSADWANSVLGTVPWSSAAGDRLRENIRAVIVGELAVSMGDQGLVPFIPSVFCKR